ncbi:MAG: phage virion morphogenesis protein [Bacteroidales bacterium]|nr:phage virion morphogenesis protein [Bacteroidales bacterium]
MSKVKGFKEFSNKLERLNKTYKKLPNELAAISVKFSKERFRDQAWLDRAREKWPERKRRRPGTKKRSQTLLVDSGRLKRSVRKIHASVRRIIIGSDAPYAQIHNEGGTIDETVTVPKYTVRSHKRRSHTRKRAGRTERVRSTTVESHTVQTHKRKMNTKIPQRQFMGSSYTLATRLINHSKKRFDQTLKR